MKRAHVVVLWLLGACGCPAQAAPATDDRVQVFSPVDGQVRTVVARAGQRVKRGDTLATIEAPDIRMATSDLVKAEADLLAAEHDFARQRQLYAAGEPMRDYEAAEEIYQDAKAELERARARAQLLRRSADTADDSFILRSSVDGEVVTVAAARGLAVSGMYNGGVAPVALFTIDPRTNTTPSPSPTGLFPVAHVLWGLATSLLVVLLAGRVRRERVPM
jgi:multidrug resistance efflux pump